MRMYDLILRKKAGEKLSDEEIHYMIEGYTKGTIPDYQMSAMLMAVCFQGFDKEETKNLTLSMAKSGDVLDLSSVNGIKVDKHSTGGVGDKTTLVLGPLLASLGIPVAKMSGRGLGHTGGTIDKLESISGFSTDLNERQFISQVNEIHLAIAGQTKSLAPADKKLYALRDVTGTVDEISLIASSIMSKKLASGADAIVLDVKTGDGAFMKSREDANRLADEMISIGLLSGKKMAAVISDMDQPLGYAVGNALEVIEAVETLKGGGPGDLTELVLTLGSCMMLMAGKSGTLKEAEEILKLQLTNGKAFASFCTFVKAQGGDLNQIRHTEKLPKPAFEEPVSFQTEGYIADIQTEEIGRIVCMLGGGRQKKEDLIDHSAGIVLKKKKGDFILAGEPAAYIYANDKRKLAKAKERLLKAYTIKKEKITVEGIIKEIIL